MAVEALLLGLRPRPRDLAPWCQSRMEEGGIVPPHSVLAPGSALGLLPQQSPILRPGQLHCSRTTLFRCRNNTEGDTTNQDFGSVVRSKLPWQLEIPPVWANSNVSLDAAASARHGGGQAVRRGDEHDLIEAGLGIEREHDARRAEVDVFVEWFNRVWKGPPNAIEAELRAPAPDQAKIDGWGEELREWLHWFEGLLDGRDHLMGDAFGAADVAAFPFLKYGLLSDPDDDELFHRVLVDYLPIAGTFPNVEAWIRRVDDRPRA